MINRILDDYFLYGEQSFEKQDSIVIQIIAIFGIGLLVVSTFLMLKFNSKQ